MKDRSTKLGLLQRLKLIRTTIAKKTRRLIIRLSISIRRHPKKIAIWAGAILVIGIAGNEFIKVSSHAVQDVGYLFGWIIGASKSEIASVVAPLVFGLLGTVIFASFKKLIAPGEKLVEAFSKGENLKHAAYSFVFQVVVVFWLLALTGHFIEHARRGISKGSAIRNGAVEKPDMPTK